MLSCRTVAEAKAQTTHSLADMQDDLEHHKPFAFCKFGDGEIFCALGFEGLNADHHHYDSALAEQLRWSLRLFVTEPRVYLANWTWTPLGPLLHSMIDSWGVSPRWVPHYALLHMSPIDFPNAMPVQHLEEVARFYRTVRADKRQKVLVCPKEIGKAAGFLLADSWVQCPMIDGYSEYDRIVETTRKQLAPDGILLTCYGMPAKPLIATMLTEQPHISCVDIGSGLDPLFLGPTRYNQIRHNAAWNLYPELIER